MIAEGHYQPWRRHIMGERYPGPTFAGAKPDGQLQAIVDERLVAMSMSGVDANNPVVQRFAFVTSSGQRYEWTPNDRGDRNRVLL